MKNQIKIYKWKYSFRDISESDVEIKVTPKRKLKKPESLFKFYSLYDKSIESAINNYVYAAHPDQFNDIYDCYSGLIDFDKDEFIRSFFTEIFPKSQIEEIISNDKVAAKKYIRDYFKSMLYRKWGILSLTSNPNNILMWSYYNKHEGFCIEFDYTKFQFKHHGPFPINYQKKIKPISVTKNDLLLSVIYQTNIKSIGWSHENEWRIIIDSNGEDMYSPSTDLLEHIEGKDRYFHYQLDAVKSITLGAKFFNRKEKKTNPNHTMDIDINLNHKNGKLKNELLTYISSNTIECNISFPSNNFNSILHFKGKIEKISDCKYIFYAG